MFVFLKIIAWNDWKTPINILGDDVRSILKYSNSLW